MATTKTKDLDYYLNLRYKIMLVPQEDGWGALIEELKGCVGAGDSPEEALAMLEDAKRGWIQARLDVGFAVPEPHDAEQGA